ncbi:MAG: DUF1616 domain-containing protein [Chloroflexi bacterium]|nr:DUF1616 domain-containing protein [Chloroflexota bacterium]
MRRNIDLLIVLALALDAGILSLLLPDGNIFRVLLALPLVLALPGYALSELLFAPAPLQSVERVLTSLGFSIALTILCGFALNWTPWGLTMPMWMLALIGVTFVCSALAYWRRRRSTLPNPQSAFAPARAWMNMREGIVFALAGAVVMLALFVATTGAIQQPSAGFSQLWLVPTSDGTVQVGVTNMEQQPVTYRLVLRMGSQSVREWSSLHLQPGEQWKERVALASAPSNLEALLYRSDAPDTVYRRVAW